MIVHIFDAERYHLDPRVSLAYAKKIRLPQVFIFYYRENIDEVFYSKFIKENIDIKIHLIPLKYRNIMSLLAQTENPTIVIHGGCYRVMAYLTLFSKYKDIRWSCWGAGTQTTKSWKSRLFHPFKKIIYNKFSKINVLVKPDAVSLKNNYNVNSTVIPLLEYNWSYFPYSRSHILEPYDNPNLVYIGNSHFYFKYYIQAFTVLRHLRGKIAISCMANYKFSLDDLVYRKTKTIGIKLFGYDKFCINTSFYPIPEYFDYMNEPAIYICPVGFKQTGIGAITYSLLLGKKVYIEGDNYNWISSLGYKVHNTKELLNIELEDFLRPDPLSVRLHNYDLAVSYKEDVMKDYKWQTWLSEKL